MARRKHKRTTKRVHHRATTPKAKITGVIRTLHAIKEQIPSANKPVHHRKRRHHRRAA